MKPIAVLSLILGIVSNCNLFACTGLKLTTQDGSMIHGRTLEFGEKIMTSIAVVPRNYPFTGTTPQGKGLAYRAKYAVVGAIMFDENAIVDGINEKGLSVGTFYFPGYADYADIRPENQSKALSPIEFPNWIITQFATVDEVKDALSGVLIAPTVSSAWGNEPPPFHYIVYDRAGNCLVIEPLNGTLVTYDNPLGAFTNSPPFDWHMTYLRNFINLRAVNVPPLMVEGMELAPFGQGSGMVGLPGDFTPPSRFIRAAIYSYTTIPVENAEAGVLQAFHLLNQFDIPIGIAREVQNGITHTDYTMITCVRDPQSLQYFFKTYEDQAIKVVNLNQFDLNAKTIKKAATSGKQTLINISSALK